MFKIPRKYKIVSMLAMGYPASRPPRDRVRKPLEDIAWFNKFGA
jgi:nitroreductase